MERTVDINAQDNNGSTPLHLAIEDENIVQLKTLLEHGADLNIGWPNGETPLERAINSDFPWTIVDLLKKHGS